MILTQDEADALIEMAKMIQNRFVPVVIPNKGEKSEIVAEAIEHSHQFIINIKNDYSNPSRVTIQGRMSAGGQPLLRIDLGDETMFHKNSEDDYVYGSHIHIYREESNMAFAEPYEPGTDDLIEVCRQFFQKFCIIEPRMIQQQVWEV